MLATGMVLGAVCSIRGAVISAAIRVRQLLSLVLLRAVRAPLAAVRYETLFHLTPTHLVRGALTPCAVGFSLSRLVFL